MRKQARQAFGSRHIPPKILQILILALCLCSLLTYSMASSVSPVKVKLSKALADAVKVNYMRKGTVSISPAISVSAGDGAASSCDVPYPVHPISFALPEEKFVRQHQIVKRRVIATVVPGRSHTYIHADEQEYYDSYTESLFGLTWQKAGWDCMRHYEVIASGALPYMPDIEHLPSGTMFRFPREVMKQILRMPGVNHSAIAAGELDDDAQLIDDHFDLVAYEAMLNTFLNYTRSYLSTTGMAEYILQTAGFAIHAPLRILFLGGNLTDYQAEAILHGLRALFGNKVVDIPKRHWLYWRSSRAEEHLARQGLYGKGFSYAFTMPDLSVDRTAVEARIKRRQFDVVIYGTAAVSPLPYLDLVTNVYSAREIIFVDGSDNGAPQTDSLFAEVCGGRGICFRRELQCKM